MLIGPKAPPPVPRNSEKPSTQDVRIIFTASQSWFGRLIRRFTHGTVSHCMIEFPVWDRRVIGESTIGGVRIVPSVRSRHHIVAEFRCLFPAKAGLLEILSRLGTEYDYAGILLFAWWRIFAKLISTKISVPGWGTKAVKCSELVVYFLRRCGVERAEAIPPEYATPEDLLSLCSRSSDLFEVVK